MSGAPQTPPRIVVKLGGSLADDPSLAQWLHQLALPHSPRLVAVPGGGPFAEVVRVAQRRWRFSDHVAHVMAIGAMDQFGRMLCGIEVRATPCSTPADIEAAWAGGQLPVWLPGPLMRDDRSLAQGWDVTSDTIAAWLAEALGASGLLLVKSCELPDACDDPALLAAAGIVDRALPGFLSRTRLGLQVVHKDRWSDLAHIITRLTYRD
ncbi:MAG TPA: aspartate kinase [Burkholderiaceae bacterium]|nr:aspartate kinase [Burkholderiaceae bacterium]